MNLPDYLWPPQRRGIEETVMHILAGRDVCLQSPTGGGKTEQAMQLLQWAEAIGWPGIFYVNRKLLVNQTAKRFEAAGMDYGIRAADYEDAYRLDAPFQIASVDTERARVYGNDAPWKPHFAKLVIVDEAHIQKTKTMKQVLMDHRSRGARVVLLSATPIGLSDWADVLVVSGSMSEYRACKAIVPAVVHSITQPDMSKVKRSKTGEYILKGKRRSIFTQSIVGSVYENWKRFNPHSLSSVLYAPGKPESVFFTQQFLSHGVPWCHVDATEALLDGKRVKLGRTVWEDILGRYRDGSIVGLSSRFKLREGIDCPWIYCCMLATPIGSLASYLQSVGRTLRYSEETPDHVKVLDFGGNYLRLGSPNHDRDWHAWWTLPEHAISEMHVSDIRNGDKPEPICCPECKGERAGGSRCPHCGHEHQKSVREVIEEDGHLKQYEGRLIKPRVVKMKPDTAELWERLYWGYRKKKVRQSFAQMAGYFAHMHGYNPPRDLPFAPKYAEDWYRHVFQVEPSRLREKNAAKVS